MITDGQVRTTIAVLHAYIAEELRLDDDLLDALEQVIDQAFDARNADITCEIDDDPPLAPSL